MKNFFESVVRTPGVLFMSVLIAGFIVNAGIQFINNTGFEGPNLMAAACLMIGQFTVVVLHQLRRIGQDNKLTIQQ